MTTSVTIVGTVTAATSLGFIEHQVGRASSARPTADVAVTQPHDLAGSTLHLVVDTPLDGVELLVVGNSVRFELNRAALGLDLVFSGAIVDQRVQPGDTPGGTAP